MSIAEEINSRYSGKYAPAKLYKVTLDSSNNLTSVGEEIINSPSEEIIEEYSYTNLVTCPSPDILKLVDGRYDGYGYLPDIDESDISIINNPLETNYYLSLVFQNIWQYKGNQTENDSGYVLIQHGYFGLAAKELENAGGVTYLSPIDFNLIPSLVKTDEELIEAQKGILNWKDKIKIVQINTSERRTYDAPINYTGLKAYKVYFGYLSALSGIGRSGEDIEYFAEKESDLYLTIQIPYSKKGKDLQLATNSKIYKIPIKLTIKNELIQCYPKESEVFAYNSGKIVNYGVDFRMSPTGDAQYYAILKIWCPDAKYLTHQISSFGNIYKSVTVTDIKDCVRQFKFLVTNSKISGDVSKIIIHLNYRDDKGVEYSKDYNLVFTVTT